MLRLITFLVAAALVMQYNGFEANAQIEDRQLTVDNNLHSNNEIAPPKRERHMKKTVRILSAPVGEVTRDPTERVVLECVAVGSPTPSMLWLRNGVPYYDDQVEVFLPVITTGFAQVYSKLVITSTNSGEDRYTCQATAGMKRQSADSMVYTLPAAAGEEEEVLKKLLKPTKPTIIYSYKFLLQNIGTSTVLPCRVHSSTKAQVFWQDQYERLVNGNSRVKVLPTGDLFIKDLEWDDMGRYTCIAQNVYGKDIAAAFVYPTKP